MPFDHHLAERVRESLARKKHISEKHMFGGLGFFLHGNIFGGVWKQALIVRLGPDAEAAVREPNVRPFDITGKPMRNWVMVDPPGTANPLELQDWINRGLRFARTLPAK